MELCDKYLHDLIKLYPPFNDNIDYEEYRNKKNSLPNHYSPTFIKKNNDLFLLMDAIQKKFQNNLKNNIKHPKAKNMKSKNKTNKTKHKPNNQ